jgi:ADP-ribose pyrophosphatase YjhB (NUDIX family)
MEKYYRTVESPGIHAVILHNGKILLLKRISFPFIQNSGVWSFVSGKKERKEDYIETAYREIEEEIRLNKEDLKLINKPQEIIFCDTIKRTKWTNQFFIFCSSTSKIKLNYEHTSYKWVSFKEFTLQADTMAIFYNRQKTVSLIKSCISKCKSN